MGLGFSFVPISIAALAGIEPAEAGARLRADQRLAADQRGTRRCRAFDYRSLADRRRPGRRASQADALVVGFHGAFVVSVIVAAVGVIASFFLIRRDELEQQVDPVAEPELALDLAA